MVTMPNTNNHDVSKEKVDVPFSQKHSRRKHKHVPANTMEHSTTVAQVHSAPSSRVQSAARRNRSQSRHERHKCHKHRQRVEDASLHAQVTQLRNENYLLNRRLNASLSSLDSGLANADGLPPIDIDIKNAYQHVKLENDQLIEEVRKTRLECEKMKDMTDKALKENAFLKEDVLILKNLVYRLNVELEKFQDIREKTRTSEASSKKNIFELPRYYNKNFIKPILPLLRAYTEVIQEKSEIIEQLENNFERFSASFNELLKENETLYKELEVKLTTGDENVYDEIKTLRRQIDIVKDERDIFCKQSSLESEKLQEIHTVYKSRAIQLEKEKEILAGNLQDCRSELCTLKGKQSVLKQELERHRIEDDSKVPMVVHSAAINECKRLFQDLKNEYDSEKQSLLFKLKECENNLRSAESALRKTEGERLTLEQGNFDLAFENEVLKRRPTDGEGRQAENEVGPKDNHKEELREVKKQLKDAKKRIFELEGKLQKTKKQLQQAMKFAEDIVREQEGLLAQLHQKQKENSLMVSQFGSLKSKLKSVEKDAQEGLNSVEDKIKAQEEENQHLAGEVERLTELLRDRDISEEFPKSDNSLS